MQKSDGAGWLHPFDDDAVVQGAEAEAAASPFSDLFLSNDEDPAQGRPSPPLPSRSPQRPKRVSFNSGLRRPSGDPTTLASFHHNPNPTTNPNPNPESNPNHDTNPNPSPSPNPNPHASATVGRLHSDVDGGAARIRYLERALEQAERRAAADLRRRLSSDERVAALEKAAHGKKARIAELEARLIEVEARYAGERKQRFGREERVAMLDAQLRTAKDCLRNERAVLLKVIRLFDHVERRQSGGAAGAHSVGTAASVGAARAEMSSILDESSFSLRLLKDELGRV